VELTGTAMAENGVQVEIKAAVQLMVCVDADLIRQALLNLLLNAMQAMPRGGLVRIEARREGQSAVVEVIDEGEGIPPELLPRIFDLYFTTKTTGSGIGLAMTYRILQMHGGILEVRSSTNPDPTLARAGTTFTLRLPVIPPHPAGDLREAERLRIRDLEKHV
jgi:signal transduction histidine kinase